MIRPAFAILLTAPGAALAADPGWSIGAHLGTRFVPNAYPVAFPTRIDSYDFDRNGSGDDVDGDGAPDATTLERVRGDLQLGVEANRGVPGLGRLGVSATFDAGQRFTETALLFTYERQVDFEALALLAGGGAGFGSASWRGLDEDERLRLPNYPLRAQAGLVTPLTDRLALQGRVFGQVAVPASHTYRDLAGNEQEVSGMPLLYTTIGFQLGVAFRPFAGGAVADSEPASAPEPAPEPAPAMAPGAAPAEPPPATPPATPPPPEAEPPAEPAPPLDEP